MSAGGAGASPRASNDASTKRSSALCGQAASLTGGTLGSCGDWKAQKSRSSALDFSAPRPRTLAAWPGSGASGQRRALRHPGGQVGDFLRRQFCFRRHLHDLAVVDRVDQQAGLGVAGLDRRAGVAPLRAWRRANRAAALPRASTRDRGTCNNAPPTPAGFSFRKKSRPASWAACRRPSAPEPSRACRQTPTTVSKIGQTRRVMAGSLLSIAKATRREGNHCEPASIVLARAEPCNCLRPPPDAEFVGHVLCGLCRAWR